MLRDGDMPHDWDAAFQHALAGTHLAQVNWAGEAALVRTGMAVGIAVGADATQPFTVVAWSRAAENRCLLTLSPALAATGRTEFVARRLAAMLPLLDAYYLINGPAPHRAIHLNLEDHTVWSGLSFCGRDADSFLMPDPVFVESRGYAELRARMAASPPAWADRRAIAVWRGATTGVAADWRALPRIRLCALAAKHPDLLDAGISAVVQLNGDAEADIRAAGLMRAPIPEEGFALWRYQIDIDGNTNSWPGLYQKLLSGSPVIKVASPGGWRQWYYDRLVPWYNYVPAAADLADLTERVRWLRDHDELARDIGRRGRDLALSLEYDAEVEAAVPVIKAAIARRGGEVPRREAVS
jgi:hypothetical protein